MSPNQTMQAGYDDDDRDDNDDGMTTKAGNILCVDQQQ